MMSEQSLNYDSGDVIMFRDYAFDADGHHAYRWVDSKRFTLRSAEVDDHQVLTDLISADQFRDDYVGGGIDPHGTMHGPYWISHISPGSYRSVGAEEARAVMNRWLSTAGSVPPDLMDVLRFGVFDLFDRASSVYELDKLGNAAISDYGFIHTEFHEFVVVDRKLSVVHLIVAADD